MSFAYIGLGILGTVIGVAYELKGRPLGISTQFSMLVDAIAGWGTAISAPWPMLAMLGLMNGPLRRSGSTKRGLLILAALFFLGGLVEPITWSRSLRSGNVLITSLVLGNIVLPAGLVWLCLRNVLGTDVAYKS
jgi:hypothetical protein